MKVEIYFDVVCPWCYIGERRFLRALEATGANDVEVVFRPFQLDPGAPLESRPIAEYLERRFGAMATSMQGRVAQFAAGEGIRIDWTRARMANTLRAHQLVRLAQLGYPAEVRLALVEGLFRAHFEEGGDVGDVAELASIAERAGMDRDRVMAWLGSEDAERDVRDALAEARAIGIQSVPTYVFDDRFAVEGAQSIETFIAAMDEVRERSAAGAGAGEN